MCAYELLRDRMRALMDGRYGDQHDWHFFQWLYRRARQELKTGGFAMSPGKKAYLVCMVLLLTACTSAAIYIGHTAVQDTENLSLR